MLQILSAIFFVNVGPKLAERIPKSRKSFFNFLKSRQQNSLFLEPTTADDIAKVISSLNPKKSLGPNSIPSHILKTNSKIFSPLIAVLVNQSFDEGIFPESLKIAKVIPVYKEEDPTNCSNYRPISLLSVFSKIFERIMYSKLYSFLEKYNIIYKRQFGFREKHSTNHALANLIETIKSFLDNNFFVCGIFIDLKKAFDTVDHDILTTKLLHYGIRGKANSWLKSFLSDRKQYVSINGFESELKSVKCGVPQGSTQVPLLFLLYVNDLYLSLTKNIIHHFGDDTNMIYASKKIAESFKAHTNPLLIT